MVEIKQLTKASEEALKDIVHLISELRRNPEEHTGSISDLQDIIGDKNVTMMVAKDGTNIVGMATLYMLVKVGKHVGYVEDVVVDSRYRGQGLGAKLMQSLVAAARDKKLNALFLTSNAKREAANNLYTKLGFEIVETNPYKLRL